VSSKSQGFSVASRGGVGRHACRAEGKRQQYQCAERHQGPFSAESAPAVSEDSEFCVRPGKAKRSKAQGRNARGLVAEVLRVAAIHSSGRRTGAGRAVAASRVSAGAARRSRAVACSARAGE
jgi:hypothetical protein